MCFCSNQLAAPAVLIAHCSGGWQWFQFIGLHIAYEDTVDFVIITLWATVRYLFKKVIFVWLSNLKCGDLQHLLTVDFCICCKNTNLSKPTNFYSRGYLLLCGMVYFYKASFPSGWLVFSGYMHFVAHSQFAFFFL